MWHSTSKKLSQGHVNPIGYICLIALIIFSCSATASSAATKQLPLNTSYKAEAVQTGTNLSLLGVRLVRDQDLPAARTSDIGSHLQIYLKNISAAPVQIAGYAIDGINHSSLPTACNPFRCLDIPDVKWWMAWPNPVAPGAITTLRIRLVDSEKTLGLPGAPHTLSILTDKGIEIYTIAPAPSSLWMPFIWFSDNLAALTVYVANRGAAPIRISADGGIFVNDQRTPGAPLQQTLTPGDVVPVTIALTTPLALGSNLLIRATSEDGTRIAFGSLRALPSTYGVTAWALFPDGADPADLARHHIDTTVPGSQNFQDEPTGGLVSPQQLADRIVSGWNSTKVKEPCMIQLSGYDENLMYADMCDVSMTHHGTTEQDESLFLTWPKPIWYLPQNAWGRMENIDWQKEYWYRLEDLQREAFQAIAHGAKNIQWFANASLWQQGYGRGGGTDYNRTHQDFYMPGTTANPIVWDRVGRISGILQVLKPYLLDSSPAYRKVDANGIEISTIVNQSPKHAVITLIDQKTDRAFYKEATPATTQATFSNITVQATVPGYITATSAYVIDLFKGAYTVPLKRTNANTVELTIDKLQSAAIVVLGDNSDQASLSSAYASVASHFSAYGDAPMNLLTIPAASTIPAAWSYTMPSVMERLVSLDTNVDSSALITAKGNTIYLLNQFGSIIWQKTFPGRIFYAKFSTDNRIIYVAANMTKDTGVNYDNSHVLAYSLSGNELWRHKVGPTIFDLRSGASDNGVFYSDWNNNVVHLGPQGNTLWSYITGNYPNEVHPVQDGGAIAMDHFRATRIGPQGTALYVANRGTNGLPLASAVSPDGSVTALAGYKLVIFRNGAAIASIDAGRGIRKIKFSPDGRYIAVGSSDGIFTLLTTDGTKIWEKIEKNSYVTEIQFLPVQNEVAIQREYFAYTPQAMWKFRDAIQAYDMSGRPIWQHEGYWRNQPFMSQFVVDSAGTHMVVGTNEQIRFVGLTAPAIPTSCIQQPALPKPWKAQDIGIGAAGGQTLYSPLDATFNIRSTGLNIGGTSDSFHFAYVPMTGDGEIVARINVVEQTDSYVKAGVMMRESLSPGARETSIVFIPPQGGYFYHSRSIPDGSTDERWVNNTTARAMPAWVKMTRKGQTFSTYYSADGVKWVPSYTAAYSTSSLIYVGLVMASRNNAILGDSLFDNISITGIPPSTLAPTNGSDLKSTPNCHLSNARLPYIRR